MKKPSMIALIAASAGLWLSGCALSPSQPKTFAGLGHFEQYQLNRAIFRVSFRGSPDMSQGTAEEITLLKAAKTTVDAGYRYFSVLKESKTEPRRAIVYPDYAPYGFHDRFYTYHRYRRHSPYGMYADPFYRRHSPYGFYGDPFYRSSAVYPIDPVEVSYTIHCSKTPSTERNEFDATLILASLGQKYYLNADGSARVIKENPPAHSATTP